jgi:hypothetical protein
MASIITATTTSGLTQSADNSGVLQLASGTGNLVTIPSVTGTAMVSGNMPAFSATKSANQTVTSGVFTTITFDTEQFDTNNNFASNTFTPTVAGYYQINLCVYCASSATTTRLIAQILKNGGSYRFGTDVTQATGSESRSFVSTVVYMNGTTDYLTAAALPIGTGTLTFGNLIDNTCFNGVLVRAA